MDSKSDEELMEQYQKGNALAFDILFSRHSGRVFGYLAKRLIQKKEAEDLLQNVFFKLHRSKHQYNKTLPFLPWLFSITRSVLLDHLKKRHLEDPTDSKGLERAIAAGQTFEPQVELFPSDVLEALPKAQLQAVSLRVYDDETFEEIALRLKTSPENARQLVSRGLKRLRQIWGDKKE